MAKATKKQALGRGLSALLKDPENDIRSVSDKHAEQVVGNIVELELISIETNPFQPRTSFNETALEELATSIRELGVIQPITVRKLDFDRYQLVSGERRFRAAKMVGLKTIPAYVRIANDRESLEMALVENIQRQDLDPIEIALSYQRLIEEIDLTQEALSDRVGKNRSTIANYLRLLKLDPIIQTGMRDGFISMGHGRALINVENGADQLEIYERILSRNLSVRETEALVRQYKDPSPKKSTAPRPPFAKEAENKLNSMLGVSTKIKVAASGKGQLTIPFKDVKHLQAIIKRIEGED